MRLSQSIKMVEKSCLVLWKFVVNQERDIDENPVLRLGCGARELRNQKFMKAIS